MSVRMIKPVQIIGSKSRIPVAVTTWANQVVTNGGAKPSIATQLALGVYYSGLLSKGLLAKMIVVLPLVPDSLTAALTPLIVKSGGSNPWTNHNFVSGDLTVNGLIGNGSSKYLDSGLVPSSAFANTADGGLTVYTSGNSVNASESDFNVSLSGTQAMALYVGYGGTAYLDLFSQTAGSGRISAANSNFTGYLSGNRGTIDGNTMAIYKGNSGGGHSTLTSSTTSVGGTLPTSSILAFAQSSSGGVVQYSAKRYSFFAVHTGLNSADSANHYSLIQSLRTALGGGFV